MHSARKIGVDPAEVRRKNYIPASEFPGAATHIGFPMDTGDYETNLDALLETAGYENLKAERDRMRTEGRLVGLGLATYVEVCGFGPSASGGPGIFLGRLQDTLRIQRIGLGPGAGRRHRFGDHRHRSFRTRPSDHLGADRLPTSWGSLVENIRVSHGDTAESPLGIGTFGSRSAAVDGSATYEAANKVRGQGR